VLEDLLCEFGVNAYTLLAVQSQTREKYGDDSACRSATDAVCMLVF
jgi:hypothetical protein